MIREFLSRLRYILPGLLIGVMVLHALSGYTAPVYAVPVHQPLPDMESERSGDNTAPGPVSEEQDISSQPDTEAETESETETGSITEGQFDLPDGDYTGQADGYGGKIKVRVTLKDGSIIEIKVLDAEGEDPAFLNRAKKVIQAILHDQDPDVDTISEATYSSRGIINAVKNALQMDVGEEEEAAVPAKTASSKKKSAPKVKKASESGKKYKDGTYTGSASGYGGKIKVKVTIKNGKIKKIRVLSASGEGPQYLKKAKTLIKKIIGKQTTNVDTVSGATYSSAGLINAVRNALKKAATGSSKKSSGKKKSSKSGKDSGKQKESGQQTQETENLSSSKWADGTYQASAKGFGGNIEVAVTIENGRIKSIQILHAEDETKEYFDKAKVLAGTVVERQSVSVDTVAGATYSSRGLLNAIIKALNMAARAADSTAETQAGIPESSDTSDLPESSRTSPDNKGKETNQPDQAAETENTQTVDDSVYADGDFTGTGEGFEGDIKVKVSLQGGKIRSVTIVSAEDDDPYFSKACALMDRIVKKNGTDVDIISGASYSSRGILAAVNDALARAKEEKAAQKAGKDPENTGSEQTGKSGGDDTKQGSGTDKTKQDSAKQDSTEQDPGTDETKQSEGGTEKPREPETKEKDETQQTKPESNEPDPPEEETHSPYRDGTYEVSGVCKDVYGEFYDYTVHGRVTVRNGKITAIKDISAEISDEADDGEYEDDLAYLSRAQKKIISRITDKGTPDGVDTVAGATCSSKAILAMCREALEQALR